MKYKSIKQNINLTIMPYIFYMTRPELLLYFEIFFYSTYLLEIV